LQQLYYRRLDMNHLQGYKIHDIAKIMAGSLSKRCYRCHGTKKTNQIVCPKCHGELSNGI